MKSQIITDATTTRRSFLGGAAALVAGAIVPGRAWADPAAAKPGAAGKPCSVFNGVRIGVHHLQLPRRKIEYGRGYPQGPDRGWAQRGRTDGRTDPVLCRHHAGGGKGGPESKPRRNPTDEQRQAQLAKCRELRKMYNDAGVNIHIHKLGFGPVGRGDRLQFRGGQGAGLRRHHHWSVPSRWPRSSRPSPRSTRSGSPSTTTRTTIPMMDKPDPILELRPVHRLQLRRRSLFRRHQGTVAAPRAGEVPRPHRQPAPEGPDRRRREPAVGPGQDADQGNPPADEEGEVDVPGRHRAGIQDSRKARTPWRKWPSASSTARRRWPDGAFVPILRINA